MVEHEKHAPDGHRLTTMEVVTVLDGIQPDRLYRNDRPELFEVSAHGVSERGPAATVAYEHEQRTPRNHSPDSPDTSQPPTPSPYSITITITSTSTTRARVMVSDLLPRAGVKRVVQARTNG